MTGTGRSNVASYVIRIYRRTTGRGARPDKLAGLVENVDDSKQRAFHSMAELWDILRINGSGHKTRSSKNPSSSNHPVSKDDKRGPSS